MQKLHIDLNRGKLVRTGIVRAAMLLPFAMLVVPACQGQKIAAKGLLPSAAALPDAPEIAVVPQTGAFMSVQTRPSTAAPVYAFPTRKQRAHAYLYELLGPRAFIAPAITGGIDTVRPLKVAYPSDGFPGPGLHPAHGTVPEWGEGFEGYSKRYADRLGQGLIGTTSRYALGEILHEDVSYHRCACSGAFPRAGHALTQAFIAHTQSGRAVPSIPAFVSPFLASEVAVAAWYPARFNSSDALRISVSQFIAVPVKNLFVEFKRSK